MGICHTSMNVVGVICGGQVGERGGAGCPDGGGDDPTGGSCAASPFEVRASDFSAKFGGSRVVDFGRRVCPFGGFAVFFGQHIGRNQSAKPQYVILEKTHLPKVLCPHCL